MARGTTLFSDTFDKPLPKWWPFFKKWRRVSGQWETTTENDRGVLRGLSADSGEATIVAGNPNWTDYALDVTVKFLSQSVSPPEGGVILYLRYQNNRNFLSIHLPVFKRTIELWRRRQGDWSILGMPLNFPFLVNQWYHLRIEADQQQVWCYVDGAFIYNWETRDFSRGGIGLGVKLCQASFANLRVDRLTDRS